MIRAQFEENFDSWRIEARKYLQAEIKPDKVQWSLSQDQLFVHNDSFIPQPRNSSKNFNVPPRFVELAKYVACARFADRWDLMYRLLYRIVNEKPDLLQVCVDPDVRRFQLVYQSVRRDIHKMKAFVRFKKVVTDTGDCYLAWHMPEHLIVEKAASFFVRRFGDKPWSIFTPDRSAHWDTDRLTFTEGIPQNQFPHTDDFDEVWKTYYKSIFNPARVMIKAMKKEFSPKYWRSLPEAALIPELIRGAPAQLQTMARNQNTQAVVDKTKSLSELKDAAAACTACPIYAQATGTVFGEGPQNAKIMIVGEQPGDQDDLAGRPFVGPAGQMLNECLEFAGIKREDLYITNTVKHFKWTPSKGIRFHRRASGAEINACVPWLDAEIEKVQATVINRIGHHCRKCTPWETSQNVGRPRKSFSDQARQGACSFMASIRNLRSMNDAEKSKRKSELINDLRLALEFSKTR